MNAHRIHLRGPWEYAVILDGSASATLPVTMPCQWSSLQLDPGAVAVRFHRRFHWPKPLSADERLWLVLEGVSAAARVTLNGAPLGEGLGDIAFDITPRVRLRNELVVELDRSDGEGEPWKHVALEARPA